VRAWGQSPNAKSQPPEVHAHSQVPASAGGWGGDRVEAIGIGVPAAWLSGEIP